MINETNGNRERFSLVLFLILVNADFKPGGLYKNIRRLFINLRRLLMKIRRLFHKRCRGFCFLFQIGPLTLFRLYSYWLIISLKSMSFGYFYRIILFKKERKFWRVKKYVYLCTRQRGSSSVGRA